MLHSVLTADSLNVLTGNIGAIQPSVRTQLRIGA